jgi:hypothetical protein
MPHQKLSPGELEVLIDGESDDVAFDWILIHLGIRSNPADRPGPPRIEEALDALGAIEKLVTAGLIRIGRIEYIDGGPPGRVAPVKHVSEPIDVVRQRVVSHLESGDQSDNWRWLCWVVNTEFGDLAARHAREEEKPPTVETGGWDTAKINARRDQPARD